MLHAAWNLCSSKLEVAQAFPLQPRQCWPQQTANLLVTLKRRVIAVIKECSHLNRGLIMQFAVTHVDMRQ